MYDEHNVPDMQREFQTLWGPVMNVGDDNPQEALIMCQQRLENPAAYLPDPVVGSEEEIRIMGNYTLSMIIRALHLDNGAPSPDVHKKEDVLIALREAAEGAIRYPPPVEFITDWIVNDYILYIDRTQCPSIDDWRNVVKLQRPVLQRRKQWAQQNNSSETRHRYRISISLITGPLQRTEALCPQEQNQIAYEALDEAVDILQGYVNLFGMDPSLERLHIEIILSMTIRLDEKGASNEQATNIFSYLRNCQSIMTNLRSRDDSNISTNAHYATIEEFYARAMAKIALDLPSYESSITNGLTTVGLLMQASDIYRRLALLPESLDEEIPSELNIQHARTHVTHLQNLGLFQATYPNKIDTLEHALRVAFIITGHLQSDGPLSSIPPYKELIDIKRWDGSDTAYLAVVIWILRKLVDFRGSWGLGIKKEEHGPSPPDTLYLAEKEATLSLELADKLLSIADTPETKALAEVRRAGILIELGEIRWFPFPEIPSESIALWTEAKRVLDDHEATDGIESDREEYLAKVVNHLAVADKERESIRIGPICEDIEVLWAPIIDLVSEDKLEEAIAACRARIADPISFFSTPPTATATELKARGHQQLGMSLYHFMVDKDAPVQTEEIFENLKIAEELFLAYMPWQTPAIAQVLQYRGWTLTHDGRTEESISVYRAMLKAIQEISIVPDSPEEENQVKSDKDGRIMLMTALQIRARELVNLDRTDAVESASEAWQMAQDYFNEYGSDFRYECEKHEILGDLATATYLAGDVERAIDFGEQCIEALNEFVETTKQRDDWPDENIKSAEAIRASTLSLMAMWASHSTRTTFLGKTRSEVQMEAAELFRQVLSLPVDLSQGLDPNLDLNWRYVRRYAGNLVPNAVHLSDLEKAMEILALAVKASSTNPKPVVYIPYSKALTELDWSGADEYLTSLASTIIQRLLGAHFMWVHDPRAPEALYEEYSIKLSQELGLALRLAEVAMTKATTTKARNDALLDKVACMILQGEVLKKEEEKREAEEVETNEDGKEEEIKEGEGKRGVNRAKVLAKGIWLEARTLLDSVTDPDDEDSQRKREFLKKLEGLFESKSS